MMLLAISDMNYNKVPMKTKKLAGIESIDIHFATQFGLSDLQENETWFMLLIALSFMQRKGHTCLNLRVVADSTMFDSAEDALEGYRFGHLSTLLETCRECVAKMAQPAPFVLDDTRLFTQRYWQFETQICDALTSRMSTTMLDDDQYLKLQHLWPFIFKAEPCDIQDWQQIATAAALTQNFTVINGGPGTGKTYTVARLLLALKHCFGSELAIQLAAPTGKAAQRMNESVGAALELLRATVDNTLISSISAEAVTLHRLLGIQRFGIKTRKNENTPLSCDVLIVDEASMIDTALMARLTRALKPGCKLILVGDADQLPAVESGSVLESLVLLQDAGTASPALKNHLSRLCPHLPPLAPLSSSKPPVDFVRTLTVSQRFKGTLSQVATYIKDKQSDSAWKACSELSTRTISDILSNEQVLTVSATVFADLAESLIPACFAALKQYDNSPQQALESLSRCRWLTPVRKGPYGVEALNQLVEKVLFRSAVNQTFYAGRPVMVVENNYAQQLFNGDTGVIWPDSKGQLQAWFETAAGVRAVSLSRLPKVETVFAITVHKSQGSEFSQVLVFMPETTSSHMASLLTKELLYTGLTRAKKGCVLVGSKEAFNAMVNTQNERHSGLGQLLTNACLAEA